MRADLDSRLGNAERFAGGGGSEIFSRSVNEFPEQWLRHGLGVPGGADARPDHADFLSATRAMMDDLGEAAALLDVDGTILYANTQWERRVRLGKHALLGVGDNYAQFEWQLALQGNPQGICLFDGLLEIMSGVSGRFETIATGSGTDCHQQDRTQFSRLDDPDASYTLVTIDDVPDCLLLESSDRSSLAETLCALANEFDDRTGIRVHSMIDEMAELPPAAETLFHNFVREAFCRIHDYANAKSATLALTEADGFLHLVIWSDGRQFRVESGCQDEVLKGIGIARIEGDLRELGGMLSLHQVQQWTVLAASLRRTAASGRTETDVQDACPPALSADDTLRLANANLRRLVAS